MWDAAWLLVFQRPQWIPEFSQVETIVLKDIARGKDIEGYFKNRDNNRCKEDPELDPGNSAGNLSQ